LPVRTLVSDRPVAVARNGPRLTRGCGRDGPVTVADQPRPTYGMPVAMTVMNSTLAVSGRLAM
jgi:hypothetical protein